jgi:hypothetical protein
MLEKKMADKTGQKLVETMEPWMENLSVVDSAQNLDEYLAELLVSPMAVKWDPLLAVMTVASKVYM